MPCMGLLCGGGAICCCCPYWPGGAMPVGGGPGPGGPRGCAIKRERKGRREAAGQLSEFVKKWDDDDWGREHHDTDRITHTGPHTQRTGPGLCWYCGGPAELPGGPRGGDIMPGDDIGGPRPGVAMRGLCAYCPGGD